MNKTEKKVYGLIIRTKEEGGLYGSHDMTITLDVVSIESGYKIRNLSRSYGDEPLADFAVKAYLSDKYDSANAEGAFFDCYKVDARDVRNMASVFKKLESGTAKLNAQFGYPPDFGSQVARIAIALGIQTVIRTRPCSVGISNYDEQDHQFFTIGESVAVLNRLVWEFREKYPLPVKETVAV